MTKVKNTKLKKFKTKENDENYMCYFCGEDDIEVNGQPGPSSNGTTHIFLCD